jgi:two-component system cell cycle sensor histidine kinase/response regulator CckA
VALQIEGAFREVLERSLQGVMVFHESGIAYVNQRMADLHGYPVDELLQMAPAELAGLVHPEDRVVTAERSRRRRTGEPVDPWVEIRIVRKDGTVRWIRSFNNAIDFDGQPAVLTTSVDITVERELAQWFGQAQRMESLGLAAAGLAHDFTNALAVITSRAELISSTLSPSEPIREHLKEIEIAAEQGIRLTQQLLRLARYAPPSRQVFDLSEAIERMARLVKSLAGERVRVVTRFGTGCFVHADPSEIEQVLMNLVVNARDAMPAGGELNIVTAQLEIDTSTAASGEGLTPGPYVLLSVGDSGSGIDERMRSRLFEAFATTKEESGGIGLVTVQRIVRGCGGRVVVDSQLGRGTTFRVYLPRVGGG